MLQMSNKLLNSYIAKEINYFPYIKNYIETLDSTHLPVQVSSLLALFCQNKKIWLSQNI